MKRIVYAECIEEMAIPVKTLCIVVFLVVLSISGFNRVNGAGECGESTTPDMEAIKLAPCVSAAQNEDVSVSAECCAQLKEMGENPSCLCAAMLSDTSKSAGVQPEIAITIPKRCDFAGRPVGYKCGDYTLP